MPAALPWQKRRPFLFARILAWCNDRVRAIAPFAHERLSSAGTSDVVEDARPSGEALDLPRHSYDASLLFRRMAAPRRTRKQRSLAVPRATGTMHVVSQQGTLRVGSRAGVRRARESRLARILPQCHDVECSRRGGKLRSGGAIPADATFHRLRGNRVIGFGQANPMRRRNAHVPVERL